LPPWPPPSPSLPPSSLPAVSLAFDFQTSLSSITQVSVQNTFVASLAQSIASALAIPAWSVRVVLTAVANEPLDWADELLSDFNFNFKNLEERRKLRRKLEEEAEKELQLHERRRRTATTSTTTLTPVSVYVMIYTSPESGSTQELISHAADLGLTQMTELVRKTINDPAADLPPDTFYNTATEYLLQQQRASKAAEAAVIVIVSLLAAGVVGGIGYFYWRQRKTRAANSLVQLDGDGQFKTLDEPVQQQIGFTQAAESREPRAKQAPRVSASSKLLQGGSSGAQTMAAYV